MLKRASQYVVMAVCILIPALAEDWPEWRGKGRVGIWNESGILDRFPEKGLTAQWRTPINGGFAGPAVAAGRVFVTDFESSSGLKGTERALCLDEKSGKILWASGLIVRQGDRCFINNDRGELIIAKLSPQGYQEISRTPLIKPTTNPGNRRELGAVNGSHPAYANRCIFARNDEEIISVSLAKWQRQSREGDMHCREF